LNTPVRVVVVGFTLLLSPWCVLPVLSANAPEGTLVRKVAETFDEAAWPPEGWNKAGGNTSLTADVPPSTPPGKSLQIEVRFSGKGFEWFAVAPSEPLAIPGDAKSVRLHYKLGDKRYPLIVKFKDGWGRTEKKLEWAVPEGSENQWATATFKVPADWVRPVSIAGLTTHNWSAQSEAKTVHFCVDQFEVETDLANVEPDTGRLKTWKPDPQPKDAKTALAEPPSAPLVGVAFSTGQVSNVFSGQEPAVAMRVRNWKPGALRGTLKAEVVDNAGSVCDRQEQPITVEATAGVRLALKTERFGLYTLNTSLAFSDGTKRASKMAFAKLAPVKELSAAEKRASPYGINVNGGREQLAIEAYRKAGIVWFRDYAFSYEWLLRAKGDDHRYAGWPWFPSIVRRYSEAGAMVLPCLMKSMKAPDAKAGTAARLGPDRTWVREIADVVNAFPRMTHWELDNEYDLNKTHADAEAAVQWGNYRAYHRKLAEIVELLGGGEVTTVEQGTAGIFPERVRQFVQSGDFEKVGVVNCHHYCGTEAPEVNIANWNTDTAGDFRRQPPELFFDRLRSIKRAAVSDGRTRESWLTEFGWDNLAGPKVSAYQQAVYLPRAWLLALAAGTDKCFWFYDYDAKEPKQFFDGCGLLTADGDPKLALCAMAGLASVLPNPKYVGSINAGKGTCGYVFTSGGQQVAALWSIEDESGLSVTFRAKELRDYLGNRLSGLTARLTTAPVYAVGLAADDPLFRQTAYELSTPHLVGTTAGDPVKIVLNVNNNRTEAIDCKVRVTPPEGWVAVPEVAANVPKGQTKAVELSLAVPGNVPMGSNEAVLTIFEQEAVKQVPLRIMVQPAIAMEVGPLGNVPGKATVAVKVSNRSAKPLDGTLGLRLPKSWKAASAEIPVKDLKPEETRKIDCELTWSTQWQPGETAAVVFDAGGGRSITRHLVPGRLRLRAAKRIAIDGRADDWRAEAQLPDWMISSAPGQPAAKISLAWAQDGLYGLVEVAEADLANPDARSFWTCNCLELFLDTRDDKRERNYVAGDHQFWFVPLVAEKRVYAGQWKRGEETSQTRYDLRSVEGVAVAKGRGYVMEFRLPASELKGFQPVAGRSIGVNINLSIKGKQGTREACWPGAKSTGAPGRPALWGSMEFVE